ncbi:MAG: hypothetical protein ACRYFS_15265 [Janthinobacterium lividum]
MEHNESCRFCGIADGHYNYPAIDQPFLTSASYMAVASIGALMEGWSLIIPKQHQFSVKEHYGKKEFQDVVDKTIGLLRHQYGSVVAFEHGANKEGSIVACGTNHAHLHLVPLNNSLVPELQDAGMQWTRCRASEVLKTVGDEEYLFYTDLEVDTPLAEQVGYIHIIDQPVSQFFRKVIADRLDCTGASNYRDFPNLEVSSKTRLCLSASYLQNKISEETY